MLLIVVLGIMAKLASVSGDCDVGKTVHNFDFSKFTGFWFFVYHSRGNDVEKFVCPTDYYFIPVGNSSRFVSLEKGKRNNTFLAFKGSILDRNNTGYSQKYDGKSKWNGRIYIKAVDYKRYFIAILCTHPSNIRIIIVAFRYSKPNNATIEEAKKASRDNNIDFSQLEKFNTDRCLDSIFE